MKIKEGYFCKVFRMLPSAQVISKCSGIITINILSAVREVYTLFFRSMCDWGSLEMLPGRGGMIWGLTDE